MIEIRDRHKHYKMYGDSLHVLKEIILIVGELIPIKNLNKKIAARYRNKVFGLIFQSFNLISYKNALDKQRKLWAIEKLRAIYS